jgi:hypothetical protein
MVVTDADWYLFLLLAIEKGAHYPKVPAHEEL